MSDSSVSRRRFLNSALGLAAVGPSAVPDSSCQSSPQAWVIVERDWEYEDQCAPPTGDRLRSELFLSQTAAQIECQRLCEEFFASHSIPDYESELETYLGMRSSDSVTWAELRAEGFPDPYFVQLLPVSNSPTVL